MTKQLSEGSGKRPKAGRDQREVGTGKQELAMGFSFFSFSPQGATKTLMEACVHPN